MTSRVYGSSAGMSLPQKFSPSPSPITSGEAFFATTTRPGSASRITAIAYAPSTCASARRTAASRSSPARDLAVDQVRDDLGVGIAENCVPGAFEPSAQRQVVLDDAVVDHRDLARDVRVGVGLGYATVRGPTRVADAGRAFERRRAQRLLELAQLAHGAHDADLLPSWSASPAES